jgi:arylformamidase
MKYLFLSHIISKDIPVYTGTPPCIIKKINSLSQGDSANSCKFFMGNHAGTHIDAPNHFFRNGKMASKYPVEFWIFKSPRVIEIKLSLSEILCLGNWLKKIKAHDDILLLKSGFGKFRSRRDYVINNPGIHPEVGIYLRSHFPKLRVIGIDWISISSFRNRELGRAAHRAFLDPAGRNNPILIIEDMLLANSLSSLKEVLVLPLRMAGLDSSPCTIIGKMQ